MFGDLRKVAQAAGADAGPLERALRARVAAVARRAARLPRRTVFLMEWLDPPFSSGHWAAELTALAGGRDDLARPCEPSRRVSWEEIEAFDPEALILIPCGLTMRRTRRELSALRRRPWWRRLRAVRKGEVYVADGPSYFNGAGPRLVEGLEILAEILHPEAFPRRRRRGYMRVRP